MSLMVRSFNVEDTLKIELNDYAKAHIRDAFELAMMLNDVEAETVVDENGKIHAIFYMGQIRGDGRWYCFAEYAKDCSKMIVRTARNRIKYYVNQGKVLITMNGEEVLDKFHKVVFRG